MTLVGVPGIGKSRLVAELFAARRRRRRLIIWWRQGRSLPYGEGVSFWALGEIVKAQAGILESDSAETAEAKLAASRRRPARPTDERAWVERHLRPLARPRRRGDAPATAGDEAFAAWRRFLEAIAERGRSCSSSRTCTGPTTTLLDFVDQLVEWALGVPLLVVCTTRPELLDRRPGWGGGKRNATTISLAPLSTPRPRGSSRRCSTAPLLDADAQAQCSSARGGNPLYAEQYARMLAEAPAALSTCPRPSRG